MTSPVGGNDSPRQPDPSVPKWARRTGPGDAMAEERMAAFIGQKKWDTVYRRKFAPFLEDPSFTPTWNWSAALAGAFWFLYRKLYLAFAMFFFLPNLAAAAALGPDASLSDPTLTAAGTITRAMVVQIGFALSSSIAAGGVANWLLFRRARAATEFVQSQQLPPTEAMELLTRVGGVHRFVLILAPAMFIISLLSLTARSVA